MTIYNREMISTIIDYLDLPLSKKAEELCYYGPGECFIYYDYDRTRWVQVDLSIDVSVGYGKRIEIEVFSSDKPITTLCLTPDNFYVRSPYTHKGRLQYEPLYNASLD